jgi:hypothetical protein
LFKVVFNGTVFPLDHGIPALYSRKIAALPPNGEFPVNCQVSLLNFKRFLRLLKKKKIPDVTCRDFPELLELAHIFESPSIKEALTQELSPATMTTPELIELAKASVHLTASVPLFIEFLAARGTQVFSSENFSTFPLALIEPIVSMAVDRKVVSCDDVLPFFARLYQGRPGDTRALIEMIMKFILSDGNPFERIFQLTTAIPELRTAECRITMMSMTLSGRDEPIVIRSGGMPGEAKSRALQVGSLVDGRDLWLEVLVHRGISPILRVAVLGEYFVIVAAGRIYYSRDISADVVDWASAAGPAQYSQQTIQTVEGLHCTAGQFFLSVTWLDPYRAIIVRVEGHTTGAGWRRKFRVHINQARSPLMILLAGIPFQTDVFFGSERLIIQIRRTDNGVRRVSSGTSMGARRRSLIVARE